MAQAADSVRRLWDVGGVDAFPEGRATIVNAGRREIGVFNLGGTFHALLNKCPHGGAPLCRGTVSGMSQGSAPSADLDWVREGEILRCPWHGWEFEIETGRTITEPPFRVKSFDVFVRDGRVLVKV